MLISKFIHGNKECSPIMKPERKINVVLFSGGRGGASIARILNRHPQVELSVLLNAYDDGLSTGRLRKFVPGMLGPSDIRKNIWTLMPDKERNQRSLAHLLEFRLPIGTSCEAGRANLRYLCGEDVQPVEKVIEENYRELTIKQTQIIRKWAQSFLDYENIKIEAGEEFDYGDTSIGNLLFTGCFLLESHDFNKTILTFESFCELKSRVINITDGANLVLTALKEDGTYLSDECAIVSPQDDVPISEIFLLKHYLPHAEVRKLHELPVADRTAFLRTFEVIPEPNTEALEAIAAADLVIFGPGTQHSSLLPSYLTKGVFEALESNPNSEKVFVANITHDHDIPNRSVNHLLQSLCYCMGRKGASKVELQQVVSKLFVQSPDPTRLNFKNDTAYLPFDPTTVALPTNAVAAIDWEEGAGFHSGGRIVDELIRIAQQLVEVRLQPYRHMLSVVVPVLNEIQTIEEVLDQLHLLDLSSMEVSKEIIVVDGGSDDGTLEKLRSYPFIQLHKLSNGMHGRGAAIRLGMEKAHGNVIVVFPSDNEYDTRDIARVAAPIISNDFQLVLGSRLIRCDDLDATLKKIYGNNFILKSISKLGGLVTSLTCLLLFNRYIGDPFTTIKAIDANLMKQLNLTSNGMDLETELIAKARLAKQYILEVPVSYHPRKKSDGKKVTTASGLMALYRLVKCRVVNKI